MALHVGIDQRDSTPNLHDSLEMALQSGARLVVVPLFHPRYRRDKRQPRAEPATRSDLLLNSGQWGEQVIGKLSPWMQLDSPHPQIRRRAEETFKQEVAWATHLSISHVLLEAPATGAVNYARYVQWACLSSPHLQLMVRCALCAPPDAPPAASPAETPWGEWNRLRLLCESCPTLGVALELPAELPDGDEELARWCGEPLRALIVPTSVFLFNKKGYPALSKRHQMVLLRLLDLRPKVIVSGRQDEHAEGLGAYVNYLQYLFSKGARDTEVQRLERPYYDYLQAPLQPLQDNLESQAPRPPETMASSSPVWWCPCGDARSYVGALPSMIAQGRRRASLSTSDGHGQVAEAACRIPICSDAHPRHAPPAPSHLRPDVRDF